MILLAPPATIAFMGPGMVGRPMASRQAGAGFTATLMAKDLGTAGEVASHLEFNMPNLQQAAPYWTAADGKLGKGTDHTEIFRYAETLAEKEGS